jgi:hypothetical protein
MAADEPASLWDKVLDHLPLAVTGLASGLVFIKLFAISHGNIQTVRAIVNVSGTVEVIFGILLGALPLIGSLLFFVALANARPSYPLVTRIYLFVLAASGLVIVVVTTPGDQITGTAISTVLMGGLAITFWQPDFVEHEGEKSGGGAALEQETISLNSLKHILVILGLVILFLPSDIPWLPAEDVMLDNGDHIVGYVLGVEEGSVVVLTEQERVIERVDLSDIRSRRLCELDSDSKPLVRPWGRSGTYVQCPP